MDDRVDEVTKDVRSKLDAFGRGEMVGMVWRQSCALKSKTWKKTYSNIAALVKITRTRQGR